VSFIQRSHLNYLTQVEQFFLAQKGSGLTLSAQDYHRVSEWEKEGVPLDQLCRAIEVIVQKLRREHRGGSLRLSLELLKEEIEAEMEGPDI